MALHRRKPIRKRHLCATSSGLPERPAVSVTGRSVRSSPPVSGRSGTSSQPVDLRFAALTGSAVLPADYGGPLPTSQELAAGMAADHERLRNRVGAFALRLYQEDRPPPPTPGEHPMRAPLASGGRDWV